jgi:hypothetical protein
MIKFLFFDYRELETVEGFARELQQPTKHEGNPLFVADAPWEHGNMQLYGSIVKATGKPFQMWYSTIRRPWRIDLAYAESDDGLTWRRPELDFYEFEGRKTNIVLTNDPHGPAVIYDPDDPRDDARYKLVAGAEPSGCICTFGSPDGIHWSPVRRFPVLPTNPDCPMGFLRASDGRYVVYHRLYGYGRRIFRSESWDFRFFTGEPRMVLEPDAGDGPQVQFYGMGASQYGTYEVGTLWVYHTDSDDIGPHKMCGYQETELAYARHGTAWHRAGQGVPFIPHGGPDDWDRGNLQCASAPVYLDDEIRYYYMGSSQRHQVHWELEPQTAGLGLATLKPDRLVALQAGDAPAELLSMAFTPPSSGLFVNAATGRDGWLRIEALGVDGHPIPGCEAAACEPVVGDALDHQVRWAGGAAFPADQPTRLRVRAQNASLFSIYVTEPDETPDCRRFRAARP